jgi:hypothetical protein
VDDKAKVRAHGVFDVGASINEPFKTLSPWFIFPCEMRLVKMTSVTEMVVGFVVFNKA